MSGKGFYENTVKPNLDALTSTLRVDKIQQKLVAEGLINARDDQKLRLQSTTPMEHATYFLNDLLRDWPADSYEKFCGVIVESVRTYPEHRTVAQLLKLDLLLPRPESTPGNVKDDNHATCELSDEELQRFSLLSLGTLREEHNIKIGKLLDGEYDQWRILADRGGIPKEKIRLIVKRSRDGRYTEDVLRMIEEKQSMSVGKLFETVKEFGRMDIIKYAKEKIVPDLPDMERREAELMSQGQHQALTSPDSYLISSWKPAIQAPTTAKRPPKGKQRSKRHSNTCETCSLKHGTEYVYISYARDMKKYVKHVVAWLHRSGMAVHYDQIDEAGIAAKTAPKWKAQQLNGAEFVLVLCSPGYIQQLNDDDADNRSLVYEPGCGVSFDINYIASEIYRRNGNYRFIPVLVNGFRWDCIPIFLNNTHVYRFPDQEESIWRRLTKTKEFELPPLGRRRIIKPRREWRDE